MSSWIFVGNVPLGIKREELQAIFPEASRIAGSPARRFRHVGFATEEARDAALAKSGLQIGENELHLEAASSSPRPRRRTPSKKTDDMPEGSKPAGEKTEAPRRVRRTPEVGPESATVAFIGNLPHDCTEKQLAEFMTANEAPKPTEVRLITPRRRFARSAYAFVEFAAADLDAAVAALSGKMMGENEITAAKSTSTGVKTGEEKE
ncbi:RNA recognition motif [Carpediemonas membranifera]|uniref:RNA recognition motif n=1 Tax=Carpediemonas membranifera TaxID=201153 RepID=A0A8J6BCK6_9EUKA|nr:RNA recognition motif [Carpediemonas membranifera]|eukprot:KAG9394617.1 RNA recognition motif [Carpediemonas membranifera]